MARRIFIILASATVSIVLVAAIALWVALSAWLTTHGRALLVKTLEARAPIEATIEAIRYRPFQGFTLDSIRVEEAQTGSAWLSAPIAVVGVRWLPLLFQRRVVFKGYAPIETPAQTMLVFSGEYNLRTKSLKLQTRTREIALSSIRSPIRPHLPDKLTGGSARLQLYVEQSPGKEPLIRGKIVTSNLEWSDKIWRARGDLALEGTLAPSSVNGETWKIDAGLMLKNGKAENVPVLGTLEELQGKARLTNEALDIKELTGRVFDNPWRLEGLVRTGQNPSFDVLLESYAHLASSAAALAPQIKDKWRPEGLANVRAVCRGTLASLQKPDCIIHAAFKDVALSGAMLSQPVRHIAGELDYDLTTGDLAINQAQGRVMGELLKVSGRLNTAEPTRFTVEASGSLPLEAVAPWLPEGSAVRQPSGIVSGSLAVDATARPLRCEGKLKLQDLSAQLVSPPARLSHITGSALLSGERVELGQTTMELNDRRATLKATLLPWKGPWMKTQMEIEGYRLEMSTHLTPSDLVIEEADIAIDKAHARLSGIVARTDKHNSNLEISAAAELGQLASLPGAKLEWLEALKPKGAASARATFMGPLDNWRAAAMSAQITADSLSIRAVPIREFRGYIEQEAGKAHIRIPSARIANGTFFGEATAAYRRDGSNQMQGRFDIIDMRLEDLYEAIPALRNREVSGDASAHAEISGILRQSDTWRANGWLTASGRQLGDIPLLNRFTHAMILDMLAKRTGQDSLRRVEITNISAHWRLSNGRVRTDDLRLSGATGLDPVAMLVEGSLGLDGSLDLTVSPELSERLFPDFLSKTAKDKTKTVRLARLPIGRYRVTGTIKDPKPRFELIELSPQELLKKTIDTIFQLTPHKSD